MGEVARVPRVDALDGLRAAAAGMVFLLHVQLPGLNAVTAGLDTGVMVFFALSGYLLYAPFATASDQGRSIDLLAYATRRVLRILPAYLVAAFLIAWLRYPWLLEDPVGLATSTNPSIVVVWTLRIEVMFYALIPFAAFALNRLRPTARLRAILVGSVVSLGFTIVAMAVSVALRGYVWAPDVSSLPSFLWAFGAGMVVVEVQRRGGLDRPIARRFGLLGLGLVVLSSLAHVPKFLDVGATMGAALLIAFCVSRQGSMSPVISRMCLVGGALSYSVYLWHEAIIDAIDRPAPTWLGGLAAFVITVAVAAVVYLLVERPAIRLAQRVSMRLTSRSAVRSAHGEAQPRTAPRRKVRPAPGADLPAEGPSLA